MEVLLKQKADAGKNNFWGIGEGSTRAEIWRVWNKLKGLGSSIEHK